MSEQTPRPENAGSENTGPKNNAPASAEPETAASTDLQSSSRKQGTGSALSRIGLTQIALAVLAAIFLWQWLASYRAINDMQQQLARKIAEMDGITKADRSLLTQSEELVRELSSRTASLETRFAEAQNQRAALEALYADMSASHDESVLAEVEQMLLIASQQLQLTGNVKVAMIALQNADARLQRANRRAFDDLRKTINQDIGKLRALPQVDISGANTQLDNLAAAVDELPLSYRQRAATQAEARAPSPNEGTAWQKLLREIGQEARRLVRVENTGKEEIPLLPPSQEFFLRENLKLRLTLARLALMSHNQESFSHELRTAQLWTARYFDDKSNEGMRMLAGLKKLSSADIRIDVPDISHSLQAVRNYRLMREGEPRVSFERRPRAPR